VGAGVFKLTKQEQMIVAFLAGAIVLGTVVKQWRAHQQSSSPPRITETRN
jgi:hypothetical protein